MNEAVRRASLARFRRRNKLIILSRGWRGRIGQMPASICQLPPFSTTHRDIVLSADSFEHVKRSRAKDDHRIVGHVVDRVAATLEAAHYFHVESTQSKVVLYGFVAESRRWAKVAVKFVPPQKSATGKPEWFVLTIHWLAASDIAGLLTAARLTELR